MRGVAGTVYCTHGLGSTGWSADMNAVARFRMDEELYHQIWHDWIHYVSRGRKWSIPIAILCLISGLAVLIVFGLASEHRIIGVFLFLLGVFNVVWHYWDKHKWFAGRRASNVTGQEVEIKFEDNRICMSGPFSQSESDWRAIQKVVSTGRGMYLCPQHGILIYIPDSSLQPFEAKAQIIKKIQEELSKTNL